MTRLVTQASEEHASRVQVGLRHELELDSGYRILLLDDRGWSNSGTWAAETLSDVGESARLCVGPDRGFDESTAERTSMATEHWASLATTAQQQGVTITPAQLRHDVICSPRLLRLIHSG